MANIMRLGGGSGGGKPKKLLSSLTEGSLISVLEDGKLVPFYVAKHNYEADLNGEGRTLLVRKKCPKAGTWDSDGTNAYAVSDVDAWLNSDYKDSLSSAVKVQMGATNLYYTPGNGNTTVTTLQRSVFLLSLTELGRTNGNANIEGEALPIASLLMNPAMDDGTLDGQWLRTPDKAGTTSVWLNESANSNVRSFFATGSTGYRPCFTLPATMALNEAPYADGSWGLADEDGIIAETALPVLLWANASPTATFAPQTLTFTESGFTSYLVEIRYSGAVETRWVGVIPLGTTMGVDKGVYGYAGTSYVSRYCGQATENSIYFAEGKSGTSVNNYYGIPTRIWGVKFTL